MKKLLEYYSLDPWHMSTFGVASLLATDNNTPYLVECLLRFLVTTTHALSTKPGVVLGGSLYGGVKELAYGEKGIGWWMEWKDPVRWW